MVRSSLLIALGLLALAVPARCDLLESLSTQTNQLLENADFKHGMQAWHGDARTVYLRPDGTEGSEDDPGAVPVLRVTLTPGQPHGIYQTLQSRDAFGKLHAMVEVFASPDFKRSSHNNDYFDGAGGGMIVTDFLVRLSPDFIDHPVDLKPGAWTKVDWSMDSLQPAGPRALFFIAPPGTGFVYLKNPSLTP